MDQVPRIGDETLAPPIVPGKVCRISRLATGLAACLLSLTPVAAAQSVLAGPTNLPELAAVRPMGESQADSSHEPVSTSAPRTRTPERPISWRLLGPNILQGQKNIWMFPLRVLEGQHLKPTLALGAATGVLVALDPYDVPYFRNSSGFNHFRTGALRARNTLLGVTMVPVGVYLGGLAGHDSYAQHTALFIAESIAHAEILSFGIKGSTGRLHPSDIPPHGDFTHTWFKYKGGVSSPGSFPSGHATAAFATASVLAGRYSQHRWVPWVAYTGATFVALSRIPDRAHFPSDVFAGAALGYVIGHFVVMPQQ